MVVWHLLAGRHRVAFRDGVGYGTVGFGDGKCGN